MKIEFWQMLWATVVCLVLVVIILARQRRFEWPSLGVPVAGFISALPMPTGAVLYLYGFYPDASEVPTKLHGLHLYVAAGGVLMFLVGAAALWRLVGLAFERKESKQDPKSEGQSPMWEVSTTPATRPAESDASVSTRRRRIAS